MILKETLTLTALSFRDIAKRFTATAVVIVGTAVTVAVVVSILAMADGFSRTVEGTARPDRVIVTGAGSGTELTSSIAREDVDAIMGAPGVKRDKDGRPIATADAVTVVSLPQRNSGTTANVTLRGTGVNALLVRPEIHLIEGHMFRPAVRELIVGQAAAKQFKDLTVGSRVTFHNSEWRIVGIFSTNGDTHESELMGDAETVLSVYRRNVFQSVTVRLTSPGQFDSYKDTLTTNPMLKVAVRTESEYFKKQSTHLNNLLKKMGILIGVVMAFGASLGAVNTMYSVLSERAREVATLRTIGFSNGSIVGSQILEAFTLSLIGAAIGSAGAMLLFDGDVVNTLGSGFTQVVFRVAITTPLLATGVVIACCIGMIGGLLPALHATRLPIASVLRST